MATLVKADIFFFITSVAVVAVTVLAVLILLYILKIVRTVKDISETVKEETGSLAGDFSRLRRKVKSEGLRWEHLISFFGFRDVGRKHDKRSSK